MEMRRCQRCDLIVDQGCACPENSAERAPAGPGRPTPVPGTGFLSTSILISPRRYAHRPHCGHLSVPDIAPPVWGWITDPDPHLWRRISEEHPVRATEGNTERLATRRCQDCDA
ncbi:hypothetical protein [Thermobifida halotolerans]|nr:hypothetical protein [Thermobifida halotolerans]